MNTYQFEEKLQTYEKNRLYEHISRNGSEEKIESEKLDTHLRFNVERLREEIFYQLKSAIPHYNGEDKKLADNNKYIDLEEAYLWGLIDLVFEEYRIKGEPDHFYDRQIEDMKYEKYCCC